MSALEQAYYMMLRHLRQLLRQPWWIALSLVQPLIWLLLYGQLFQRVVELPGFHATSYISFLTPGIVVMSALFGGGWNGMGILNDLDRGVMDRFLVSPVSRAAILFGRLLHQALLTTVQSTILITLGLILGARFPGGFAGIVVLVLSAVFLSMSVGALSNALALTVRRMESVIAVQNFILLPMTFVSPVFMDSGLMPNWMKVAAQANPVNWSVIAARTALSAQPDWSMIAPRMGAMLVFTLFGGWVATRAFRSYQRSI